MFQSDEWSRRAPAGAGAVRAWDRVRKELLTEFGADFYCSFIDPLRLVAEWNGSLIFLADTGLAQERLRQRQPRLEARLRVYHPEMNGMEIMLERDIPEDVRALLAERAAEAIEPATRAPESHPLSYTFESFCVDTSNYRAHMVAQMVASGAGVAFPLTVIHGPPGCGKTHLLNSIKHAIESDGSGRRVLLMWSQEFLEHFQSSLRQKRDSSSFKEMVRDPDVLLIDDIQRIFGKKATEEEAVATISVMASRGRQVVLTADSNGGSGLDERLSREIKGATSCEITEPGVDLRKRILEQRVAHYARHAPGFSVRPEVLEMIAERLPVSGRELDGAVGQMVVEAQVTGGLEVTMEVAEAALQGKLANLTEKRVTIQLIQKVVSAYYNLTVEELLTRTRQQYIARPRQVAMYLSVLLARRSLPYTGEKFGRYDHTTVMFARDKFKKLVAEDPQVKAEIDEIIRRIRRENSKVI
jgi:chromosomal replication initiator protein